nr:venom-related protein neuropeptide F [Conus ebraeus]
MHKALLSALLVISLVVAQMTCVHSLRRPQRPARFTSAAQLRRYLRALNQYYAIVGRPRFGRNVDSNKKSVKDLGDLKPNE